ncbi:MAG: hypothetical protein WCO56_25155 [Verrucomicrobiota bacterium]
MSTTEFPDLKQAIFDASKHEPDFREGGSRFLVLAQLLAGLPPNNPIVSNYIGQLENLFRDTPDWPAETVENLCFFIELSRMPSDRVTEFVNSILESKFREEDSDTVRKRGLLIRLLSGIGRPLSVEQLDKEDCLKKNWPWMWIDAVEPVNWEKARDHIGATLKREKVALGLAARLPYLRDRYGKKEVGADHSRLTVGLKHWLKILQGIERQKLVDWCVLDNIEIPHEFEALEGLRAFIEGLRFSQNLGISSDAFIKEVHT